MHDPCLNLNPNQCKSVRWAPVRTTQPYHRAHNPAPGSAGSLPLCELRYTAPISCVCTPCAKRLAKFDDRNEPAPQAFICSLGVSPSMRPTFVSIVITPNDHATHRRLALMLRAYLRRLVHKASCLSAL